MIPITIVVRGLESEPIDALKVGATVIGGETIYYILSVDGRVASISEKDVLIYWDNEPSPETLKSIDRMIELGDALLRKKPENYNGAEYS